MTAWAFPPECYSLFDEMTRAREEFLDGVERSRRAEEVWERERSILDESTAGTGGALVLGGAAALSLAPPGWLVLGLIGVGTGLVGAGSERDRLNEIDDAFQNLMDEVDNNGRLSGLLLGAMTRLKACGGAAIPD